MISDCNLNLAPAIERCKSAYSNSLDCEVVVYGKGKYNKAPYVTAKCPPGFQRYGGTKCVRKCNYTVSIKPDSEAGQDSSNERPWTQTNYCLKKSSMKSDVIRGLQEKHHVGMNAGDYEKIEESLGDFIYVQHCPRDYKRVGNLTCIAICPLGWPDVGNKCLK